MNRLHIAGIALLTFVWSAGSGVASGPFASGAVGGFPPDEGKPVRILQSHIDLRGPFSNPEELVIRDEAAWNKRWSRSRPPASLTIDFQKQMVVIVAEGRRGRTENVRLEICDTAKTLLVFVIHGPIAPGISIPQDIIWPTHYAVIAHSAKPVEFVDVYQSHKDVAVPGRQAAASHRLTFHVEGNDLVVSTTIIANASPHALWTSYHKSLDGKSFELEYCLIHNRDLLVRSQKKVQVVWRLQGQANLAQDPALFQVHASNLLPTTAELASLLPQLQNLQQAGAWVKNRMPLPQGN